MQNEKQNKNKSSDKKKNNRFLIKLYVYIVTPCDVYCFMIIYPVKNKPICSMVEKSSLLASTVILYLRTNYNNNAIL